MVDFPDPGKPTRTALGVMALPRRPDRLRRGLVRHRLQVERPGDGRATAKSAAMEIDLASLTRPRAGWPRRRRPALFDLLRDPSA